MRLALKMLKTDDIQILKKIKNETNLKINKLTLDFQECAKLIEDIKTSSNSEIPKQVEFLTKRLETDDEVSTQKSSSHRSRYEENKRRKSRETTICSPPPSMYRYYNPFSTQISTNNELSRSLSPDDKIKMMKGKNNDLSPRLLFIKNSMKEILKTDDDDDDQSLLKFLLDEKNKGMLNKLVTH